jgi:CheY-like chemotaxis protein
MYTSKSSAPRSLRVLVVEDGLTNRQHAIGLLKLQGHIVTAVSNGVQALQAVRREAFDIVFMDIDMPEMDGLTATREIRSGEMLLEARIPIVAVTSNDNRDECLRAGMDAHLQKPLRPEALTQVLGELVRKKAA